MDSFAYDDFVNGIGDIGNYVLLFCKQECSEYDSGVRAGERLHFRSILQYRLNGTLIRVNSGRVGINTGELCYTEMLRNYAFFCTGNISHQIENVYIQKYFKNNTNILINIATFVIVNGISMK